MGSGQGTVRENELVRIFDSLGYSVIRSPSSGARTDRPQPDVLASKGGWSIAMEVKYGDPPPNLSSDEIPELQDFADGYSAPAVVALRYKRDKCFYLVDPYTLNRTKSDNFSVPSDVEDVSWAIAIRYEGTGKSVEPTEIEDFRGKNLYDSDYDEEFLDEDRTIFDSYFECDRTQP